MMSRSKVLFSIIFFLFVLKTAQVYPQESALGNWLIYLGDKKIGAGLNWHHEVQYRNYNAIDDLEQLLIRTGLGYNLSETNNNVLLGYGFIYAKNYTGHDNDKIGSVEHRIFQQFITRQQFGRFLVQHRYRFEQRFFTDSFRARFRYFLAANLLLNNQQLIAKTWYLSGYNEIFLNATHQPFDRNRLYGGVGYKISDAVRVEAGYMNQIFADSCRDQINIMALVSF